ncbi:hypothetical protein CAPTEDRAFT_185489 [Capitella teleta]|uniref:MAM domain-containing protein n=1 Tax=Capitella teleta TaxID=283909 RepID=R7VD81_CAPTE|nr:hypothetical protein CAPTEDRAFT_185489 [Capitella teleta]|eukprot:ELU16527.1 hypothetical protein CAPTEDRAFT_185489 [Capitella teleta]
MYKVYLTCLLLGGTVMTGAEIDEIRLHGGAKCEVEGSSSSDCKSFLDDNPETTWTARENPSHIRITVWFAGLCEVSSFRFMQLQGKALKAYKALKLDFGDEKLFMAELTERTDDLIWEEFTKSPSIITDHVVITIASYDQWPNGHGFVDIQFWGKIIKLSTTKKPVSESPRPTTMVAPASGASSDRIASDCSLSFTVMTVIVILFVIQSIFVVLLVVYIIRLKNKAKTQVFPSKPTTIHHPAQPLDREEVFIHQNEDNHIKTGAQGFWRQKDIYGCYLDVKETPEWDMFGKSLTTEAIWSRFGRYAVDLDQRESMILDCRWKTELPTKYRKGKTRRKAANVKSVMSSRDDVVVDINSEVNHDDVNTANDVELKAVCSSEDLLERAQSVVSGDIDNTAMHQPNIDEFGRGYTGKEEETENCDEMKPDMDLIADGINKKERIEVNDSLEMVPPLSLCEDEGDIGDATSSSSSTPSDISSSSSTGSSTSPQSTDSASSVGSLGSSSSSSESDSVSSPSSGSTTSSSTSS